MNVTDVLLTIPRGSLRSDTWVAVQLGFERGAAQAAGRVIARETLRRWPTPEAESSAIDVEAYPWWRVVGRDGDVATMRESHAWCERQVDRLTAEGHVVVPSPGTDGLRVHVLPPDFA